MKPCGVEKYSSLQGSVTMSDERELVSCPKPRRMSVLSHIPVRSLRWRTSEEGEGYDSKGGVDVLDMIVRESYGEEQAPYFVVSPPVRASNPLIQDSQFVYEKHTPPILSSPTLSASSSASGLRSPRKAGCVRMKIGINADAVRVEGFDSHIRAVS